MYCFRLKLGSRPTLRSVFCWTLLLLATYAALHVVRPTGPGKPKRGGGLAAGFRESVPVRVHHLASTLAPRTFKLQLLCVGTDSGFCNLGRGKYVI